MDGVVGRFLVRPPGSHEFTIHGRTGLHRMLEGVSSLPA